MRTDLVIFLILAAVAHLSVWFQLNSQFIQNAKISNFFLVLMGIPISYVWIKATEYGVKSFDGNFWPQRLIAFAVGIVLYTFLTHYFFGEKLDTKSVICLILSFSIVAIQLFWK